MIGDLAIIADVEYGEIGRFSGLEGAHTMRAPEGGANGQRRYE